MDHPSALDLAFLDLETPQAPLHVGWTLRFSGTAPSLAALRRHLDARLHAVPRFRRRLVPARLGLAAPQWVDDPGFDVARHAFALALPAPGGLAELRAAAGVLLSQPLPGDRPLWRIYLVDGDGDGFALVGQAHHALVDGIAAIEVAQLLFGPPAAAADAAARSWTPSAAVSPAAATRVTAGARLRAAADTARGVGSAVLRSRDPAEALRDAARALEAATRPAPETGLDRSVTRERAVAFARVPLDAARAVGRAHGATINDVLLAAALARARRDAATARLAAGGLAGARAGERARRRGHGPRATASASCPSICRSARPTRYASCGSCTPARRPPRAAARPARCRRSAAPPTPCPAWAAGSSRRAALRAVGFDLVISNVPGPPVELSLLGRPLTAVHPMVPLLHGHALTIGAVSYADRLNLGLAADAAVLPEVVELAHDLEAAFDALRLDAEGRPPDAGADALAGARSRAASARGEPVDGAGLRDDVDAPARVLAERVEPLDRLQAGDARCRRRRGRRSAARCAARPCSSRRRRSGRRAPGTRLVADDVAAGDRAPAVVVRLGR